MFKKALLALSIVLLNIAGAVAQTCPDNIDFIKGDFTNWVCSAGNVDMMGIVSVNTVSPITGRHTLIPNTANSLDTYGKFPVTAPNGAAYTLKLGNESGGNQAERVSYTYTIPADKQDFIFTYYYAAVLQISGHPFDYQRPRFGVKLTDVTTGNPISCGTHDFVSGDGSGDFKTSTVSAPGGQVQYRDWSTVAINLAGLGGHTIRFDFTTNDCVFTQHFGYAYLSFSDPCDVSNQNITGGTVCSNASTITLTAPPGFDQYSWHLEGSTDVLSSARQYIPPTIPPNGTKYAVEAESFTGVGQGCPASFKTTIHILTQPFELDVKPSITACASIGANLKDASVTAGTTPGTTFKYFTDPNQKEAVRDPTMVTTAGTYYILGNSPYGCSDMKSVVVTLIPDPDLTVTPPAAVCKPATVDLTDPAIVGDNASAFSFEYYTDVALQNRIPNPKAITDDGTYYIKASTSTGCVKTVPVKVTIYDIPFIKAATYTGCSPLDLTAATYRVNDTNGLTYAYYEDAAGTIPLAHPDAITISSTYYLKGTNVIGCATPAPVPVKILLEPVALLEVLTPTPAKLPATVNLANTFATYPGYTYTYYTDTLATNPLANYNKVAVSGTYYIKAISTYGCVIIKPVTVLILEPDEGKIVINNTFTPNGDGVNDEFTPLLEGISSINYLKIFTRNGAMIFETKDLAKHWNGTLNGSQLPQGTYYWIFSGYDDYRKKPIKQSGPVTIVR